MTIEAESAEAAGNKVKALLLHDGIKPKQAFVLSVDRIVPGGYVVAEHTPNVVKIGKPKG